MTELDSSDKMVESKGDVERDATDPGTDQARIQSLEETIDKLAQSQQLRQGAQKSRLFANASDGNVSQLEDGTEVLIAGLGRRMVAALGDNLPLAMFSVLAYCLMIFAQSAIAAIFVGLFGLTLSAGYHLMMLTNKGQTFGRSMAQIRVVMFQDGRVPNAAAIFKRCVVSTGFQVIPWILLIPTAIMIDSSNGLDVDRALAAVLLWLASVGTFCVAMLAYWLVNSSFLWSETGQGWHDRVAGTIVILSKVSDSRPV